MRDIEHKGEATVEAPVGLDRLENGASRCIISSLLLRASFGGMTGDVLMLTSAAEQWTKRLFDKTSRILSQPASCSSGVDAHFQNYLDASYIDSLMQIPWGQRVLERFAVSSLSGAGGEINDAEFCLLKELWDAQFTDSGDRSKGASLSKALALRQLDIIPEGVDFHCDWKLVPFVVEKCDMQEHSLDEIKIKSLIWMFRSSINNHRMDAIEDDGTAGLALESQLVEKNAHAKEWRLLCSYINEYCAARCLSFWKSYCSAVL